MLLLLLTGNCVYVCMYVYIYTQKGWGWCVCEGIFGAGLLLAQRLRQRSVLWANTEPCWTHDKNILPPAPAAVSALEPLKSGWAEHGSLLAAPPASSSPSGVQGEQLRSGTSPGDSHFLFAGPEVREGPCGHGLAPAGHALNSKHSRFSQAGTATNSSVAALFCFFPPSSRSRWTFYKS